MDYFSHNTFANHYKTAEFFFESAKLNSEGQFYHLVSCISFCAFSLEAYINHQGYIEQNEEWNEWDLDKHPCFKTKVKKLAEILHFDIDFNNDIFSIITPLFQFRDFIVHGRTEQVIKRVKKPQNNTKGAILNLSSYIDKFCTIKNAEVILKNTKEIMEQFNEQSQFDISKSRLFSLGNGSYAVKRT